LKHIYFYIYIILIYFARIIFLASDVTIYNCDDNCDDRSLNTLEIQSFFILLFLFKNCTMLYTKWRNVRTIDQVTWRNSNGFTVPLYREIFVRAREISYLSENIGGAWTSLVIQHYGQGTIRINLEVRNPGCGGSMAASYITVTSGQKATGKRREECSLRFRSLRVVKKKENITRDHVFLSAQLYRVWFYAVEYAMRHPRFISGLSASLWPSVISHQVLCIVSQMPEIDQRDERATPEC